VTRATVAAVFAGGCVGGLVRYAVAEEWPAPTHLFPWATFAVNIAGAFILGTLIVVISDGIRRWPYLRPLVGTGFCGALTTFSSVVVSADELIAHGHAPIGVAYLTATITAGLAAAALGVLVGRVYADHRRRTVAGGH
jgi:fluoride exporter